MNEESPNFYLPIETQQQKLHFDIPTTLQDSMKYDSKRQQFYSYSRLIINGSEDESDINSLLYTGILDSDPKRTTIFRMSKFSDDINNELRNIEILSTIKLCIEVAIDAKTIDVTVHEDFQYICSC
ncbi:unnamed protein product [Rotaria sordida]|uniref:Uncharacterized protein n=1 Tax=Rotaria sordida TaxID=392033 RepID=A0A815GQY7_9BILA|nr:unnamed protein product [Rotaria sordida]CAF1360882.1 unnamed protein product [Rotaria sordida]CAF1364021.1 unnamed protein product [Rotaria sordida]CAF3680270.1 unnamed protein product [Rotaria sordida]CAF3794198.1 unnamed protein product [Rotaria sordida]